VGIAIACATGTAQAEIELGGIVGLHTFSEEGRIGVVDETEPRSLRNSALFGFRLGAMFGTFGAEAELGVIPSEPRQLLFDVTSLTYRAHLVYQMLSKRDALWIPFAFVGAGRLQIIDSANEDLVKKDAVIAPYVGIGVKYRTPSDWGVRLDARALFVPKVESGIAFDTEILLGVYREWGRPKKAKVLPPPPKDDDPDKDGIAGAADKCPTDPEDIDSFEDTDGCSDQDNDQDQVPDAADKCPLEPETRNGFEDEDGCPDEIPAKVAKFNGVIKGITFKVSSADLAPGSNKILDEAIAVMTEFKDIKLEIGGHTDDQKLKTTAKFADNTALSQARADTVKAYFVGKGIEDARLVAKGYGESVPIEDPTTLKGAKLAQARAKNRRVEFRLITAEPAGTPPPPAPEPAAPPAP